MSLILSTGAGVLPSLHADPPAGKADPPPLQVRQIPPPPPPGKDTTRTVNKRAVRILLECMLVNDSCLHVQLEKAKTFYCNVLPKVDKTFLTRLRRFSFVTDVSTIGVQKERKGFRNDCVSLIVYNSILPKEVRSENKP